MIPNLFDIHTPLDRSNSGAPAQDDTGGSGKAASPFVDLMHAVDAELNAGGNADLDTDDAAAPIASWHKASSSNDLSFLDRSTSSAFEMSEIALTNAAVPSEEIQPTDLKTFTNPVTDVADPSATPVVTAERITATARSSDPVAALIRREVGTGHPTVIGLREATPLTESRQTKELPPANPNTFEAESLSVSEMKPNGGPLGSPASVDSDRIDPVPFHREAIVDQSDAGAVSESAKFEKPDAELTVETASRTKDEAAVTDEVVARETLGESVSGDVPVAGKPSSLLSDEATTGDISGELATTNSTTENTRGGLINGEAAATDKSHPPAANDAVELDTLDPIFTDTVAVANIQSRAPTSPVETGIAAVQSTLTHSPRDRAVADVPAEVRAGVENEAEAEFTSSTSAPTKSAGLEKAEVATTVNVPPNSMSSTSVTSFHDPAPDKLGTPDGLSVDPGFSSTSAGQQIERGADIRSVAPSQQPALVTGNALAREVTQAALSAKNGSTVELFLDPVELGKLEIEFTVIDDRMSIIVRAEREDALELMRRNSDELQRLMRETNVNLGSLSFSHEGSKDQSGSQERHAVAGDISGDLSLADPRPVINAPMSTRIDIRI